MNCCLSCNTSKSGYWYLNGTQCKNCYHKVRYLKNREKEKERSRIYREENRAKRAEHSNSYRRQHKEDYAFNSAKYRAAKLKRTPIWLTKQDWETIEGFYKEANRLTRETGIPHHVDHIIPLQGELVSGLHVPSNLQILTRVENISKSNKVQLDRP